MGDYDALDYEDTRDRQRLVVEWILSSVCNFACSYCPPHLHDGRVRWPDYDIAIAFCQRVIAHYRGRRVTFLFTGGEVTQYRRFIQLAREVRSLGASVAVLSNGSRPLAWWEEAVPHLDEALLSFHVEFAELAAFRVVVQLLASRIPVQINVLMLSSRFDECLAAARTLEQVLPNVVVHRKPLLQNWKRLEPYDERAHKVLHASNRIERQLDRFPRGSVLKGDMIKRWRSGPHEAVSPIQLIVENQNGWRSWECAIGLETLVVRWDEVYRGICRVGGLIGSIYDPEIVFPKGTVICSEQSCNCIGGIKARKWRLGISP